jgi:hypothetical protein
MTAQRVVADIHTFPAFTDDGFWTNWHHYVYVYNGTDKQIWIDGVMLIEGTSANPLPVDFRDLFFGFDTANYQQAVIDDVAVFATPLSAANIGQLATNNASPTSLAGETLLAYWDFNTLSPGPPFVAASSVPMPGSTNVLPNVNANIFIVNRTTQVQTNSIRLSLNGVDVTGSSTITSNAVGATIAFTSPTLLPALSSNTISVSFADNAATPNKITNTWLFFIEPYNRFSRDVLHGYVGFFQGNSSFTPDQGGHTGATGDRALDLKTDGNSGAFVLDLPFLNAVNAAAGKDTFSVSYWEKLYVIANASSHWFNSPSVGRAFQAHTPWGSDDTVYFDTGNGSANRISDSITMFPAFAGDAFWRTWHNFVLLKNGGHKEIWIDGQMLTSGDGADPMVTDTAELFIGSAVGGGSLYGQIDDFAVFGEALTSSQITSLAGGTPPTALNDTNLLAYWNFEDVGPAFLSSRQPAPNSGGVAASGPLSHVVAVLVDGTTAVKTNTIALKFNGSDVTASSAITSPQPTVTRVEFVPPMQPSLSSNVVTLTFSDNGTPANLVSNTWTYVTEAYSGTTKDVVHSYLGFIQPAGGFTTNGGGHTGNPGDYAIDMTPAGGPVHIDDASFLDSAGASSNMTFSFWMKRYDINPSSVFWLNSPLSPGSRASQAHLPYSDDNVYWDTSGCCDPNRQRIQSPIDTLPGFTDDSFWTNHWHNFVFVYNAGDKQIWIDGTLFFEGSSTEPLPATFTDLFIGSDGQGGNAHALTDDFAAFGSAVAPTNIALLASGTLPTALKNELLLAYWPFDDAPTNTSRPLISIGLSAGQIKITYTGTLQSSTDVVGTFQDVPGAISPYTVNTTLSPRVFYRSRQ